ncbi:hypothetical protein [Bacillus thuringiensis]|uniref:hypothetical protein n=1 Tax=Bacillus thuringiensis TaxID=1428 RepID=UPI000A375451|nr:hypothetical protein [Bacillus thuringiensis]OTZ47946.1 hypothetical protein BK762_19885 [Bacillus thuringiensis serovar toumanoffi]
MMDLITVVILSIILVSIFVLEAFAIYTSDFKNRIDQIGCSIFVFVCTVIELLLGIIIWGIAERIVS